MSQEESIIISQVEAEPRRIIPLTYTKIKSKTLDIKDKNTEVILLSIENGIHRLITDMKARDLSKSGITDITEEQLSHLPTSGVGILIHYFLEGIKRDYNIVFDTEPKSIKGRGNSNNRLNERTRLLNKKQKQNIIDGLSMEYYRDDIDNGVLTIPEVLDRIQKCYNLKTRLEECGMILSPNKSDGVMYQGIDYKENSTPTEEAELIIKEVNEKIILLVLAGIIELPKQERKTTKKEDE